MAFAAASSACGAPAAMEGCLGVPPGCTARNELGLCARCADAAMEARTLKEDLKDAHEREQLQAAEMARLSNECEQLQCDLNACQDAAFDAEGRRNRLDAALAAASAQIADLTARLHLEQSRSAKLDADNAKLRLDLQDSIARRLRAEEAPFYDAALAATPRRRPVRSSVDGAVGGRSDDGDSWAAKNKDSAKSEIVVEAVQRHARSRELRRLLDERGKALDAMDRTTFVSSAN
eukprot:TRINITY_DN11717_c0_g1_i8.p1 TRINITY_DN11717_c0_g1~~TRINITY_DN11717_c0_g1_i8.p1  ORF type:complete len:234 (-),score=51.87 TRINITY_DN11717_c0_g1_i8:157-858(-)